MAEIITIKGNPHVVTQCGTCGVWFTVPEIVYECHRREGGYHTCPNGHSRGWRTGEEEKARDAIRLERDRLKQDAARLEDELVAERRRAEAAEKKILQVRRRAAAGVCPCCNRTFANVQRHMLTKHANVVPLAQKPARGI
jgi:hypothetical protein